MLEVHAVDRPDHRGRKQDRRPRRNLLDLIVLLVGDLAEGLGLQRQIDTEDVLKQLAEPVGLLLDAQRVVVDVTQIATLLVLHARRSDQALQHHDERLDSALESDDLAGELIDPPRDVSANAGLEHLVLDLVDVVLHARHHGRVVIDDPVHDRVQDRHRAAAQQVGACLQATADGGQIGRLAVADRDHELWAGEDVHLTELDGLRLVDVAGRMQDAKQRLAVVLELGALVRADGILDGELVQRELARDVG